MKMLKRNPNFKYNSVSPKISGYCTVYNGLKENFPFEISIRSALQFCDEVVCVDGCSDDGTYELLQKMSQEDPRLKIYQNDFDLTEPGIDGNQKAFARCLCENDILEIG